MTKPILAAILSCSGTKLTAEEKRLFASYNPLGVSLFTRNIQSQKQVKKLIQEIKETINRDNVLIAIDEEGGRVCRLENIKKRKYASAEALGKVDAIYSCYHAYLIAAELRDLGININYTPVIDKKVVPQNKVLESRCFSEDDNKIVECGKSMASAYMEMGICPCVKHIPGHFSSLSDPHLALPESSLTQQELNAEINYIKNFNQYPLGMTSHILLKNIDSQNPATQSSKVITDIIRGYLQFDGFLLSDAIDMHALSGSVAEKTQKSLDAGIDAVCCCSGKIEDLTEVCQTNRFLTEKSLIRFAFIEKVIHNEPKKIDLSEIQVRYDSALKESFSEKYSYDATEVLHQMLKKGESL